MLKLERKLLGWVEKNMLLLMALLTAVIGLYLRKTVVWWGSPDMGSYFDGHENHIQSAFYYLSVGLVQYLPMLPLHSVKWSAGLADYAVAALCLAAVGGRLRRWNLKSAFFFTVCILSPVAFLRGICWAQVDSIAFAFLLGACLLWEKGKKAWAVAPAALGTALYPCLLALALAWLLYKRIRGKDWIYAGAAAVCCCVLQGLSGMAMGQAWTDSLLSCIRWTTYDPYQGTIYKDGLLWVKQMVNLFGYSAAMAGGIAACRRRISFKTVLAIHLAVLLVYGSLLFPVAA